MSACALSLVLCTYRRQRELGPLLDSLLAQHFRDFEVLVVDQNEDERLLPLLDSARERGLRLTHLRLAYPNLSAARNLGLRHAHGRWVGFPDDDCWYEPALLQQMVAHFSHSPACDVVLARWAEFTEPAALPHRLSWSRSRRFRDRLAASFMLFFDRQVVEQLGGFDPRLGVGQWFGAGEETELMLRLLRAGKRAEFCPSAIVHHPLKPPSAMTPDHRQAIRARERGTGALYAIHRLPWHVCWRGLLGPWLRQLGLLCVPGRRADLRVAMLESLGRAEGWFCWRWQNRTRPLPVPAAPVVEG